MKKIALFRFFSISLAIASMSIFGACGGIDERFKDEPEKEVLSGVLVEQTAADQDKGSHFLIDENDAKIAVRSVAINLSSPEYLNNELELMGVFNLNDDVFEVTGVSVLEVLSDDTGGTAEFVDYKNTEFGFEFGYYEDWTIVGDNDGLFFYSPSTGGPTDYDVVRVTQSPFDVDSSDPDYYEDSAAILVDYFDIYLSDDEQFQNVDAAGLIREIGPDRLDALVLEYDDGVIDIEYLLYRSGLVYSLTLSSSSGAPGAVNKRIFSEMLGRFRFLGFEVDVEDDDETALDVLMPVDMDIELATFESLSYGFSGKYPSDWYYAGSGSSEAGVLRHYGFGDTPDFETDILGLDVMSGDLPGKPNVDGRDVYEVRSGSTYTVYNKVDGQVYRLSGDLAYQDLLFIMATNINPIDEENL